MGNPFSNMWNEANKIAEKQIEEERTEIRIGLSDAKYAGQDARCAKDWFDFIIPSTSPVTDTCNWINRNLLDDPSVDILTTLAIYIDEDGLTDENEAAVVRLMERIERSNHLMTRWEQMLETQLVSGLPNGRLMITPTRLVHYIRAMGFVNPWEEQ